MTPAPRPVPAEKLEELRRLQADQARLEKALPALSLDRDVDVFTADELHLLIAMTNGVQAAGQVLDALAELRRKARALLKRDPMGFELVPLEPQVLALEAKASAPAGAPAPMKVVGCPACQGTGSTHDHAVV